MGIQVLLCGPDHLLPEKHEIPEHCRITTLQEAAKSSHALMFLRVQHERHEAFELNIDSYNEKYGLNDDIISLMPPESIIMHPGPVNRDVEIKSHLVEHKKSKIFKQMENGVYTRMAILEWLTK